jgi:hypothetical protein|tara:strand:- start:462 stop:1745 length:1284 start_codon:yes stop_codon:yes gene_type:complete
VPGIFNFFNKEKEQNLEVSLQDIELWVDSQSEKIFDNANLQGNILIRKLRASASDVRSVADEFLKTEINTGELDQPLIPTIRNSRNSIANKIINTVSNLEFQEVKNFNDLTEIAQHISQSLAQIDQTLKTHGRVVFTILNKEVRPLLTELKRMQREAAEFSQIVEKNSDKANKVKHIRTIATRLITLNAELLNDIASIDKAKRGSADVIKGENEIIKRLEEVKHSEEYQDSQRIKEEARKLTLKQRTMEAEFDTLFSRLRKPLEKYGYSVQLKKEDDLLLKRYDESPSKGLINDKVLAIAMMLEKLKDAINREKISIKNPEKVLKRIEEIQPILKSKRDILEKTSKDYELIISSQSKSAITKVNSMQEKLDGKRKTKEDQEIFIEKTQLNVHETAKKVKDFASIIEENASEIFKVKLKIVGLTSYQD